MAAAGSFGEAASEGLTKKVTSDPGTEGGEGASPESAGRSLSGPENSRCKGPAAVAEEGPGGPVAGAERAGQGDVSLENCLGWDCAGSCGTSAAALGGREPCKGFEQRRGGV